MTRADSSLADATAVEAGRTRSPLLDVRDLCVSFPAVYGADVDVVSNVSFSVDDGECLGIVGESGSGKTLVGLSIIGLCPRGSRRRGSISYAGRDIARLSRREWRKLRGSAIAMIYQDALTSLNPSLTIGFVLRQVCRLPGASYGPEELLDLVSLPDHGRILASYPHELSGGQRQRVLVGMALARQPRLIIADEPTTALDLTVQAEIVQLLQRLTRDLGFSLVLISHDLGLVSALADRIAVLYAGSVAEVGPRGAVLRHPRHPYSAALLSASESLNDVRAEPHVLGGFVPSPRRFPVGCRFRDRCERAMDECRDRPELVADEDIDSRFACFNPIPPERHVEGVG
jgi:peptide/nickel transport system permease protein